MDYLWFIVHGFVFSVFWVKGLVVWVQASVFSVNDFAARFQCSGIHVQGFSDTVQSVWFIIALFCISFLRKGEELAYVGSIQNLKDLKDHCPLFRVHNSWCIVQGVGFRVQVLGGWG